jgi:succinate dehydrogenase / fumarate reductase flavoprotein subunit
MGSNATAAWKIHRKELLQIHVTQFTQHVFLFQEIINQINFDVRSLRNDGRIWVPAKLEMHRRFEMGRKKQQNI